LFPEDRANKKGWRKFSLKELIYFSLIYELKKFGLTHEFLKNLSKSFFDEPTSEIAIFCVLIQAEMMLTIKKDGTVTYYDPHHYALIGRDETPSIQIRLNDIANDVNRRIGRKEVPIRLSGLDFYWRSQIPSVSDKEQAIINMLRNNQVTSVTINKNSGDNYTIYAGKTSEGTNVKARDIIKMLEKKDYQDIHIVKRDGKIVNYKVEETYKL
jgi:hypothetical protein